MFLNIALNGCINDAFNGCINTVCICFVFGQCLVASTCWWDDFGHDLPENKPLWTWRRRFVVLWHCALFRLNGWLAISLQRIYCIAQGGNVTNDPASAVPREFWSGRAIEAVETIQQWREGEPRNTPFLHESDSSSLILRNSFRTNWSFKLYPLNNHEPYTWRC